MKGSDAVPASTRGRIQGSVRAADRAGQIEIPVTLEKCGEPVTVLIALWEIPRLISQLQRAEISAIKIKELRRGSK